MRTIKISLLVIASLFSLKIQAQSFKKGFIVTVNGDTLQGFIKDGSYEVLSKQINFKLNKEESISTVYNPHEIISFEFADGDFFISSWVNYTTSLDKDSLKNVHEMRFLHRLYSNKKSSLYELNDLRDSPIFVQKNQAAITLLCMDKIGNPAYLEELAYLVSDCETLVIPDNLPLDGRAIEGILVKYDDCGKHVKSTPPLPKIMVWAGVGIPMMSMTKYYDGLGQTIQFEIRPFSKGFLSNLDMGLEYFNFNSNHKTQYNEYEYRKQTKRQELSIKTQFFLNAWNGRLRPYGFLALTSYHEEYKSAYKYPDSQQFTTDHIRSEFVKLSFHPGIGLHGQWKRHIFRVELPLTAELAFPRIGYGYAF